MSAKAPPLAVDERAFAETRPARTSSKVERTLKPLALPESPWIIDAADLLAEPDPGPTPWLVEGLIVDGAIVAAVGRWKTTKSYALLDLCISIATGRPAFGTLEIPNPGPVVFVNEESGRAALWRRLDALCRGRAIDPEELRGRLHVAANSRVKLDNADWQKRILQLGDKLRPRLFVFDPLARMKDSARDENAQADMAALIEFVRALRDESAAACCFVHHTGHLGGHMRGSSDLESAWETRLTWTREGQSPLVTLESEHREAEAGDPIKYRINWHHETRTMRFDLVADESGPTLSERIIEYLEEHGPSSTDAIRAGVNVRRSDVVRTLSQLEQAGTGHQGPSGRRDKAGRAIRDKVWNLSSQAGLWPIPEPGTNQDEPDDEHRGSSHRPTFIEGGRTDGPPDGPEDTGEESTG